MTICPCCEKETTLEVVLGNETVDVRGEEIDVEIKYQRCPLCGELSIDLNDEYDHLAEAYRIFRQRHGMVQPTEIRAWRKQYGLTQEELSRLLGWGKTTLSRYENGALQDETHDTALRLAMEPSALLMLLEEKSDALNPGKKDELIRLLKDEERPSFSYSCFLETQVASYAPDEFSGYKSLQLEKVINAILYFCREGAFKTKLNKLLFYLDFKHFKEHTISCTGLRYAHLPYGPAPNDFDIYFSFMQHHEMLSVEEVFFEHANDGSAEKYHATAEPRLGLFSDTELRMLMDIKERFKNISASAISRLSHEEAGYKATETGELISYRFAEQLQI
jgi:putative zinc finger/helix-turn-helix YgiT family protein